MSSSERVKSCKLCDDQCLKEPELEALRAQVEQLQKAVISDSLTRLYNKSHFLDCLNKELERTRRSWYPTSLILLDIDHFKEINDQHGHLAGDRVLEGIGAILKKACRITDIPCRYGGEEFGLILPATPILTATQAAERLCCSIGQTPIQLNNNLSLQVTASIGVSCFLKDSTMNANQLIERADKQLYKAKNKGRNCVCADVIQTGKSTSLSLDEKAALVNDEDTFS